MFEDRRALSARDNRLNGNGEHLRLDKPFFDQRWSVVFVCFAPCGRRFRKMKSPRFSKTEEGLRRDGAKQSRWFADFLPGQRVELRTLRYRLARRLVLAFWRSEKFREIYLLINLDSVSPLRVVGEYSRKFRPNTTIFGLGLVTYLTIKTCWRRKVDSNM